ncbi:MAG TPA: hypothetical protein VK154_06430 [Chitinophagales bacterium]|nr:hypothetical protein [Chitinophagales bacterium]
MNKTKTLVLLLAAFLMTTLGGCKKEDKDNDVDLTTGIIGYYSSGSGAGYTDIEVKRVDNNTITVYVSKANEDVYFDNCTMLTATTFTINTFTYSNNNETDTYTAISWDTPELVGDQISIPYHRRKTDSSGNIVYDYDDYFSGRR